MGRSKLVAAAILLIVALWGTIMVPADLVVPVRLWPGGPNAPIPAVLMPLLGVVGLWAALRLFHAVKPFNSFSLGRDSRPGEEMDSSSPPADAPVAALLVLPAAALAVLMLVAVDKAMLKPVPAALLLICGSLALLAGGQALAALARGEAVGLDSHWGGLGGGFGGWRVSPVTTLLLLALILLGTAVAVGGELRVEGNQLNAAGGNDAAPAPAHPPATANGTGP